MIATGEPSPSREATAYCLKCRQKQAIQNPQPVFTARGQPATRGTCPACGSSLVKMGATPAHTSLVKPETPGTKTGGKSTIRRASRKRAGSAAIQLPPGTKLVIVESPAKSRTIRRFLGEGYAVEASLGHVRDLLRSKLSVDIDHDFTPTYTVPREKRETVKRLTLAGQQAAEVFLATDPDREGEAIAWHVLAAALIPESKTQRVVFHEITPEAVRRAFEHPRALDVSLINAQQARRLLDRLVGYKISPLLWRKVRSRLSAGRVQSVAVRLVVEREREILAFVPVEYWSISAELAKQETRPLDPRPSFLAKLQKIRGQDVDLKNQPATQAVVDDLEGAAYAVEEVRKSQRQRRPYPPFITSSLQQDASRRLGMSPKRTMVIAQQLYEGLDIGQPEPVGLITYMRTDSTSIAPEALAQARDLIAKKYGPDFLPDQPQTYKTRVANAQEAHECIRPTSVWREPETIRDHLDADQFRLYQLIWRRFVACQMRPAIYDVTAVDIKAGHHSGGVTAAAIVPVSVVKEWLYLFRVTGSTVAFPGFLLVYDEAKDEPSPEEKDVGALPPLTPGELLDLLRLLPEQHFTEPPPRFTEATLIRELEKHGIGRPSTYAPIISTIQEREYVERVNRYLKPTELGFTVNDLLVKHFPDIVNIEFTAHMEGDLDRVAGDELNWVSLLASFWTPFQQALELAEQNIQKMEIPVEPAGFNCEKCGSPMVVKLGRFGRFVACSNYPACRNTKPYVIKTGAKCPECGADLVQRKTRKNRIFFSCSRYPDCKFSVWNRPLPTPCSRCGGLVTEAGKAKTKCIKCGAVFTAEGEHAKGP